MNVERVAVIGSPILSDKQCDSIARKLLSKLMSAYELRSTWTVKEDFLGEAIRRHSRRHGLKRHGSSVEVQARHYHDSTAMAVAGLMWRAQRFIVYWDGQTRGLAWECIQACVRMKRPIKIFDIHKM